MTNLHPEAVAILERMAGSQDWMVQVGVALFEETPPYILDILCQEDSYVEVRVAVATNPNTPFDTLKILSTDDDPNVRAQAIITLYSHKNEKTT